MRKTFLIFLFLFFFPIFLLAKTEVGFLEKKEILEVVREKIGGEMISFWIDPYSNDLEISAITLILKALSKKSLYYYLIEVPEEISLSILKWSIKSARFFYQGPAEILNELEKISLKEAEKRLKEYFKENQIREGYGILPLENNPPLWYHLQEKRISPQESEVLISFYLSSEVSVEKFYKPSQFIFPRKKIPPFTLSLFLKVKREKFFFFGKKEFQILKIDFTSPLLKRPKIKELTFYQRARPILKEVGYLILDLASSGKLFQEKLAQLAKNVRKGLAIKEKIERTFKRFKSFFGLGYKAELPKPEIEKEKKVEKKEKKKKELFPKKEIETKRKEKIEKKEIVFEKEFEKEIEKEEKFKEKERSAEERPPEEKEKEKKERVEKYPQKVEKHSPLSLIITEVCAGYKNYKEEFIEIYNPTDKEFNLEENLVLILINSAGKETKKRIKFKKKTISPLGYFLLASSFFKEIEADANFSFQIGKTGGVILKDKRGKVLDKVGWGTLQRQPPIFSVEGRALILEKGLITGKSISRKDLKDKDDNLADFILTDPNPQNSKGEKLTFKSDFKAKKEKVFPKGGKKSYPLSLLINEIYLSSEESEKDEFVELYNPMPIEIILDNFYLQRKTEKATSFSSYLSKSLFKGKKIAPFGFFLIAREGSRFSKFADLLTKYPLAENNSLILKDPAGNILDKVGWGKAKEYESLPAKSPSPGESIQRKNFQDSQDNFSDFEILKIPTPVNSKGEIFDLRKPTLSFLPFPSSAKPPYKVIFKIEDESEIKKIEVEFREKDDSFLKFEGEIKKEKENYYFLFEKEGSWQFKARAEDEFGNKSDWVFSDFLTISSLPEEKISDLKAFPGEKRGEIVFSFSLPKEASFFEIRYSTSSEIYKNWNLLNLYSSSSALLYKESYSLSNLIPAVEYFIGIKIKDRNGLPFGISNIASALASAKSDHLLINEIALQDEEFVELYNPTEKEIDLSSFYFVYYSLSKPPREFSRPYRIKKFPQGAKIGPFDYFLLGFGKIKEADWHVYFSDQLSNERGAVAIFKKDPRKLKSEETRKNLVDLVAWGKEMKSTDTKEGDPAPVPKKGESISRKILGWDSDDNKRDFQIGKPSPTLSKLTFDLNLFASSCPPYEITLKITPSNSARVDFYEIHLKENDSSWSILEENLKKNKVSFYLGDLFFRDGKIKVKVSAFDKIKKKFTDFKEAELDLSSPVIFSEFGFSTSPWWIELYNRSEKEVDLSGWKLTSNFLTLELSGKIPKKGYYLIKLYKEEGLDVKADKIWSPGRFDWDYVKELYNEKGRCVDRFSFYMLKSRKRECNDKKRSLERVSPFGFGRDPNNWLCNNGEKRNGKDEKGNIIFGTPKEENSNFNLYTPIFFSQIKKNTTLDKNLSPYLISRRLEVPKGLTLKIKEAEIKFKGRASAFFIKGTLLAEGASFVPFNGYPSRWGFSKIWAKGGKVNFEDSFFKIEGGRYRPTIYLNETIANFKNFKMEVPFGSPIEPSIYLKNSTSSFFKIEIINTSEKARDGIKTEGGRVEINNSSFVSCKSAIVAFRETNLSVKNSSFEKNKVGIHLFRKEALLEKLIFKENECDIKLKRDCFSWENYKDL